ncbi:MAG: prolipoprotein diacylglyceryl transferase [Micavibrio aeruginosavorus]|uniref:Phosphatidylglycerol--prolipoprotein diacylglyceryl transferase n=1 Tax=Micavibrio aeruginosavorus TaxID=349221 RepID=A0A7T5UH89_9BACT|nr:MAG: prolipoprotein diacylglyceryl transferase [Micavibrio aeruginosavorus]
MALGFPDIDPVAVSIGPFDIRWYALAYLAGFLLGWKLVVYLSGLDGERRAIRIADLDDFLPWAVIGVILGGRIGYILFYQFDAYMHDPLAMLRIWEGGMSFHGGAAGMILAMVAYAAIRRIHVLRLTDLICCAVPIGLFWGRLANFINGELFGRVTTVPWGMVFPHGGPDPRHPSQLYEAGLEGAVLLLAMIVLAHRSAIRNMPGILSAVFLSGYAFSRISVEFFREPDEQIGYIAGIFTMGQILCLPMLVGAVLLVVYAMKHKSKGAAHEPA